MRMEPSGASVTWRLSPLFTLSRARISLGRTTPSELPIGRIFNRVMANLIVITQVTTLAGARRQPLDGPRPQSAAMGSRYSPRYTGRAVALELVLEFSLRRAPNGERSPMRCSRCQTENREGRRFCASCGVALARACECGYVNDATDRFCGGCGRLLAREAEAAFDRPAETDGDRRPVAIMFCDLVGYTRLSSKLDPEDVRALLEQFFGVIDAIVERYGGTIDKHIGDAAMALFGAPRAHGDDALRAIRAALEIQASIPTVLTIDSGPLAVHVGIAMGEVVAGAVGSDWRRGYTVTGGAANVAARLSDRAVAGETLVSAEVYEATSHAADYEPLGGLSLKGLESPVETWRLTGLRRLAVGGSILVGRRSELAQCRAALTGVIDGS